MPAPWWRPRPVLRRFVSDLIEGELARQRGVSNARPRPWPDDLVFDQDLGVDSLERMVLATALAESLHLHESGIEDYLLVRRSLGDWVDVADAGLARFSARMTFRTSGSSGSPKPCVHRMDSLLQETDLLAAMFEGRRRVLYAVPSHHIYGFLFSVLLPQALNLAPEALLDLRASTPGWLAQAARPGDLVIGHPDFWGAVARTPLRLPDDVVGVTSTAPCPDYVSEAMENAGIARLVQVYGSSETAGIGARQSSRDPYDLFAHWTFSATAADGLIRLLPDGSALAVDCQDRLERIDNTTFLVGSRHDRAVQVGGINVFPSRVADVLKRHPLVHEAAVRLMRADEGTRLKAFVVPADGVGDTDAFLTQLRAWIDAQLTVAERPKALRVGSRLPVTRSGKQADWDVSVAPEDL